MYTLYKISYESRPEYLYAYAKGNLSDPATRIACWTEIIKRCRDEGYGKLLVVQDSPPNESPTEAFVAASGVVDIGVAGLKIGFVDPDPAEFENNKFCEVVACNRGANARLFLTEKEAHEWLIGDTSAAFDENIRLGFGSSTRNHK